MKSNIRQFFFGTSITNNTLLNIAWLLFRLHAGLSIAIHAGFPKMNNIAAPGWFVDQVAGLGFTFPSPGFWAAMAAWGEFIGGLLIAVGFLTRFAALQLAFQFFVIAFLWYDTPEPLTGMYFQHLYFWCYLLITIAGAGHYSIDHFIFTKKSLRNPSLLKPTITVGLLVLFINSYGQAPSSVSIADIKIIEGKWTGQLTYLDFTSNKPDSIRTQARVTIQSDTVFDFEIFYTDEPAHNAVDKYIIKNNGTMINGQKVLERTTQADGSLKIVLTTKGVDGNDAKPASFEYVFVISPQKFIWTKWVKYEDASGYIRRNEYVFSRE